MVFFWFFAYCVAAFGPFLLSLAGFGALFGFFFLLPYASHLTRYRFAKGIFYESA
jgi:hypothetical protein